jgi:hypothetical protein
VTALAAGPWQAGRALPNSDLWCCVLEDRSNGS